jgi:hypothetical protein
MADKWNEVVAVDVSPPPAARPVARAPPRAAVPGQGFAALDAFRYTAPAPRLAGLAASPVAARPGGLGAGVAGACCATAAHSLCLFFSRFVCLFLPRRASEAHTCAGGSSQHFLQAYHALGHDACSRRGGELARVRGFSLLAGERQDVTQDADTKPTLTLVLCARVFCPFLVIHRTATGVTPSGGDSFDVRPRRCSRAVFRPVPPKPGPPKQPSSCGFGRKQARRRRWWCRWSAHG